MYIENRSDTDQYRISHITSDIRTTSDYLEVTYSPRNIQSIKLALLRLIDWLIASLILTKENAIAIKQTRFDMANSFRYCKSWYLENIVCDPASSPRF